jgi:two-component system, OmpR family, KDP operon response regulator KdpE
VVRSSSIPLAATARGGGGSASQALQVLEGTEPPSATPTLGSQRPAAASPASWTEEGAALRVLMIGGREQALALQRRLVEDGIEVRSASPRAGIRQVVRRAPDLMLLVGGGPSGLGLLRRLRSVSTIGIITLGATDRPQECIQALRAGADDHLSPPFDLGELVARMWAVHRRTAPPSRPLVVSGAEQPLLIDLARHEVIRAGRRLHLTSTELRLLELLVVKAGVLLTHEVLLRHVWGEGYGKESNYLRVYVAQLRKKLGDQADAPRLIETTPGVGYRWIGSPHPASRPAEALVDA